MATVKTTQGTRTQLSGAAAAINSLASATYVSLGTLTHNSSGNDLYSMDITGDVILTRTGSRAEVLGLSATTDDISRALGGMGG